MAFPQQKLSDQDIADIKSALANGQRNADLARLYGVTTPVISQIKAGVRKPNGMPVARYVELTVEEAKGLRDMYLAFAEAVKCSLGPASHPLVDAQAKYFSEMLTTRITRVEGKK